MSERFFSEEEIREMGKRTVDRLTEAIDAGEAEQAKKIANRMYNEFLGMHDLYRNWTTATLSEVGKRFGDEVLEEIMTEGVKAWWLPNLEKMPHAPQDLPRKIKMFVAGLRGISSLCILKKMRKRSSFRCVRAAVAGALCWKANTTDPTHFILWKSRNG